MSMGKLPCLPHLPLPPTTWSLLRTSVSLHVNGDGPGLDTVIIHHNALVFFARSVANSSGQSCRKIEKFMKADAAIFVSTIHPDHYKIDVIVCILDELGVSISCEHWDQLKEYLRRTTCRNVTLQHVNIGQMSAGSKPQIVKLNIARLLLPVAAEVVKLFLLVVSVPGKRLRLQALPKHLLCVHWLIVCSPAMRYSRWRWTREWPN